MIGLLLFREEVWRKHHKSSIVYIEREIFSRIHHVASPWFSYIESFGGVDRKNWMRITKPAPLTFTAVTTPIIQDTHTPIQPRCFILASIIELFKDVQWRASVPTGLPQPPRPNQTRNLLSSLVMSSVSGDLTWRLLCAQWPNVFCFFFYVMIKTLWFMMSFHWTAVCLAEHLDNISPANQVSPGRPHTRDPEDQRMISINTW